jgi:hypothetical protein
MAELPHERRTLVLASGNAGKLRELCALLAPFRWSVRPQSDWALEEAVEDGLTFIENALIKARHAARLTGLPALGDESGLVVDARRCAGIYSSALPGKAPAMRQHPQAAGALAGVGSSAAILLLRDGILCGTPAIPPRRPGRVGELPEAPAGAGFGYNRCSVPGEPPAAQLPGAKTASATGAGPGGLLQLRRFPAWARATLP